MWQGPAGEVGIGVAQVQTCHLVTKIHIQMGQRSGRICQAMALPWHCCTMRSHCDGIAFALCRSSWRLQEFYGWPLRGAFDQRRMKSNVPETAVVQESKPTWKTILGFAVGIGVVVFAAWSGVDLGSVDGRS